MEAAGGRVRLGEGGEGVEVSPRVSYSGEGPTPTGGLYHKPNPTKRPGARWVEAAGGRVRLGEGGEGVEVSPRVSYSGEGLAALCRGRTLRAAHDPFLQARLP